MAQPFLARGLMQFPWRQTFLTLGERFREDRLGLSASSLTFTTSIALVPFFTVVLAVFTAFPAFAKMQNLMQAWLVESLVPEHMARQVMGYLTQFTRQASRLGGVGLAVLAFTATALVLTIDRTLNAIWRVPRSRPLAQRLLVYWAVITLGPLLLAASLAATAQALVFIGFGGGSSRLVAQWLDTLEFFLHAGALAALFRYMPNTHVRWTHAWAGALFASAGLALAKMLLTFYLKAVPTYSLIYGAFATVPILLLWIYLAWIVVLIGAVISAYLPSLISGQVGRSASAGWAFELALGCLELLHRRRSSDRHGMTAQELATALKVDSMQLHSVLSTLRQIRWIAPVDAMADEAPVWVLLADPDQTTVAPLAQAMLLERSPTTERFWQRSGWPTLPLRALL